MIHVTEAEALRLAGSLKPPVDSTGARRAESSHLAIIQAAVACSRAERCAAVAGVAAQTAGEQTSESLAANATQLLLAASAHASVSESRTLTSQQSFALPLDIGISIGGIHVPLPAQHHDDRPSMSPAPQVQPNEGRRKRARRDAAVVEAPAACASAASGDADVCLAPTFCAAADEQLLSYVMDSQTSSASSAGATQRVGNVDGAPTTASDSVPAHGDKCIQVLRLRAMVMLGSEHYSCCVWRETVQQWFAYDTNENDGAANAIGLPSAVAQVTIAMYEAL